MIDNNLMLGEAIYLRRILNIFFCWLEMGKFVHLKTKYFLRHLALFFTLIYLVKLDNPSCNAYSQKLTHCFAC